MLFYVTVINQVHSHDNQGLYTEKFGEPKCPYDDDSMQPVLIEGVRYFLYFLLQRLD